MAASGVPMTLLLLLLLLSFIVFVSSDLAKDRAECTNQLVGLAPCMSYVQYGANAKTPTPDCCSSTKTVVDKSMRCLCVLIRDRNDPNLGIKFNITRVVMLPPKCGLPLNVSECLGLLNLPKNSAEAKDFEQLEDAIEAFEAAGGNGSKSNAKGSANENVTPMTNTSNGCSRRLLGITMASGAWIFSLIYPLFILGN
ncbi:non-specific lipid transfer protein GPI-anchored 6-like [Typha latifolia]|uniref:non-specific lipid transfer protein GPI-anchored 6-like n=1 Tax=Typha latifolia TaxID=4733 RepID=UPI003C2FFB3C